MSSRICLSLMAALALVPSGHGGEIGRVVLVGWGSCINTSL